MKLALPSVGSKFINHLGEHITIKNINNALQFDVNSKYTNYKDSNISCYSLKNFYTHILSMKWRKL